MSWRFGIPALLVTLSIPHLLWAQSQGCTDPHSSTPAAAQEIKINIIGVEFRGEDPLSDGVRAKLVNDIQSTSFSVTPGESDSDWVNELDEVGITGFLRDQGYFEAKTETAPYMIRAEPHRRSYVVAVRIESGPEYRLGEIQFANVTAFAPDELRKRIDLRHGELFNVSKIRQGIESIGRLYGTKGYIDATVEPQTSIDDNLQQIDLVMRLNEEVQYRVGAVEVHGLEKDAENLLKSLLEPGSVLDSTLLNRFLKENRHVLPSDASPEKHISMRRDVRNRTVDIVLDFRRCPQTLETENGAVERRTLRTRVDASEPQKR
jgi:outer membrane protein assembly factor BamA